MLSRKHYQEIAGILADAINISEEAGDEETLIFIANEIVDPICSWFQRDNFRFNLVRFIKACGLDKEV